MANILGLNVEAHDYSIHVVDKSMKAFAALKTIKRFDKTKYQHKGSPSKTHVHTNLL